MARVKGAMMTRKRRKKILKRAKGYWGSKSTHYRVANQAVMKSLKYAYIAVSTRSVTSVSVDHPHLCSLQDLRYQLQPFHERSEEGWYRPEPQDAG